MIFSTKSLVLYCDEVGGGGGGGGSLYREFQYVGVVQGHSGVLKTYCSRI